MKYNSWEDMVNAQAIAFSTLCAQNEQLAELAEKADDGYDLMSDAEQAKLFTLCEEVYNNPFFSARCKKEWEEMDEQEHPEIPEEEPNSWDELEKESYEDLFGPWWE
jgi:hypothetical protein